MALASKVQLRLAASKLPHLDLLSPSDAYAIVYLNVHDQWQELGRTEVIMDNDSPAWKTTVNVVFKFEEMQQLRIVIMDFDNMKEHDYVGEFTTTVGRIMGSRGQVQTAPLNGNTGKPLASTTITVGGMEIKGGETESLRISFRASGLDKKDWFGSSDPYLCICVPLPGELADYKPGRFVSSGGAAAAPPTDGVGAPKNGSTGRQRLWTSTHLKNTLEPQWQAADLAIHTLCGGDKEKRPVVLEVWDWNRVETHELIGASPPVSISELLQLMNLVEQGKPLPLPIYHPAKTSKSGYKNSGLVYPTSASISRLPTLLDYVAGGCQINLVVSVDFTGSNGDPSQFTSLHYFDQRPGAPLNSYAQAIMSVGSILQEYDWDKRFPAFGFGGVVPGQGTSHCFPLNGNQSDPEVPGVDGLLAAYRSSLATVALSGPTMFAPTIDMAHQTSLTPNRPSQNDQRYTVLLLLTDGAVTDEDETIRAVVDAAGDAPLSIVIVGVGQADFSTMRMLDGDEGKLSYKGRQAPRDIVQFVPFAQFQGYPDAAEVLAEIPGQLVGYFTGRGIRPNAPLPPQANPQGVAIAAGVGSSAAPGAQGYPPAAAGGVPSAPGPGAGYPPQAYPPQQQGYGYPPQAGGYPPQPGAGYPPQAGAGYPPQSAGYPPVPQPGAVPVALPPA